MQQSLEYFGIRSKKWNITIQLDSQNIVSNDLQRLQFMQNSQYFLKEQNY